MSEIRPGSDSARVELGRYAVFLAVFDAGSFSAAARRLRRSQPSISRAVAELESDLGVPLFSRTTRRVTPTEAARALEPEARRAISAIARGRTLARQAGVGEAGTLRIGHTSSVPFHPLFVRALAAIRRALPDLRLEVFERSSDEQITALLEGDLDLGWVRPSRPPRRAGLVARRVDVERVHVLLPKRHPLAERTRVRFAEVANERFVLPDSSLRSSLGQLVSRLANDHGVEVTVGLYVRQVAAIAPLVSAGLGIALVPSSLASLQAPSLGSPILQEPSAELPLWLTRRRSDLRPALAKVLHKTFADDGAKIPARGKTD